MGVHCGFLEIMRLAKNPIHILNFSSARTVEATLSLLWREGVWSLKLFFFIRVSNANAGEVQSWERVLVAIFLFCFRALVILSLEATLCVCVCVRCRWRTVELRVNEKTFINCRWKEGVCHARNSVETYVRNRTQWWLSYMYTHTDCTHTHT